MSAAHVTSGLSNTHREFFHLLCLEFVNPQYALFQSVSGLHKPSPCSSVNPNHLLYFHFFGNVLARMICDSESFGASNFFVIIASAQYKNC